MANNNIIFNGALAGASGGAGNRWIQDTDFTNVTIACVAFATAVDNAIPPIGGGATIPQGRVIQTICSSVLQSRFPTSDDPANYSAIATAIAALFNSIDPELLAEAGGGGTTVDPLTLTYYVDAGYAGANPSDGSIAAPYLEIQDAIDALAGVSGTVLVVPSTSTYGALTFGTGEKVSIVGLQNQIGQNTPLVKVDGASLDDSNEIKFFGIQFTSAIDGATTNVIHFENCDVAGVTSSVTSNTVRGLNTTFQGEVNLGVAGTCTLINCVAQNIVALDATCTDSELQNGCQVEQINCNGCLCDGPFTSVATSGGAHLNPPFRFIDCEFTGTPSIVANFGVGAALDVFSDDVSMGSFWANGGTITGNVIFYEDSAVGDFAVYATDETNTATTAATSDFVAITGSSFDVSGAGGNPWTLTAASCVAHYNTTYAGAGTPPPTPAKRVLVEISASIRNTILPCFCGLGISVGGDIIGDALSASFNNGIGTANTPGNNGSIQITARRYVDLAAATDETVQPVLATDGAENLTVERLTMTITPVPFFRGW